MKTSLIRCRMIATLSLSVLFFCFAPEKFAAAEDQRQPNVLWICIEDQSPWFACYGNRLVATPNMDALASRGVLFERAYAPVPVCSPSRSALITGCYPIRIGTHDHRSGRVAGARIHLPDGVESIPELFRKAGYATFNRGKDDYNFLYDRESLYSVGAHEDSGWKGMHGGGDWRDLPAGTPFFGQLQWNGGKLANSPVGPELRKLGLQPIDPASVTVPPQYPDIPEVRQVIAEHLGTVLLTDHQLGQLIDRLKVERLWDNTVIFLFSDHGSDLPRSKEFCYEEGLHVPLIVTAPGHKTIQPGTRRRDLANLMDVAATSLALAGIEIPAFMDSKNVFATDYNRGHVFSSADRMSNTIDRVRSVMGRRYHYIRNFMTDRPLMQWGHREMIGKGGQGRYGYFVKLRGMFDAGELSPAQATVYGPRAAEELYDLSNDPNEVVNLATNPMHKRALDRMRSELACWIERTGDKGQFPRSEAALQEVIERYPPSWLQGPEFADR